MTSSILQWIEPIVSFWGVMDNKLMATVIDSPEQRVLLRNISWEVYEQISDAQEAGKPPRFTYDSGDLEIVTLSSGHEWLVQTMILLVNIAAEELGISVAGFGSTTFRRRDRFKGFEPDACFYSANLHLIRDRERVDLQHDPPLIL